MPIAIFFNIFLLAILIFFKVIKNLLFKVKLNSIFFNKLIIYTYLLFILVLNFFTRLNYPLLFFLK